MPAVPARPASTAPDPTPRIGILVPVGPPDYGVLLRALVPTGRAEDGPFAFQAGTIGGVPVVLNIAPVDGIVARSLAAEAMLHHYNVRAFVYAGTSGGHLDPRDMRIGDIVLAAKHVDFSNFFLGPDGTIAAGEFNGVQPGLRHVDGLYADPHLLGDLACSAHRVAAATTLPAFVATLYRVAFIEVSVISDSIEEFPHDRFGSPPRPHAAAASSSVLAQRVSDRIAIDLIERDGADILRTAAAPPPTTDPFPAAAYAAPTDPRDLFARGGCARTNR